MFVYVLPHNALLLREIVPAVGKCIGLINHYEHLLIITVGLLLRSRPVEQTNTGALSVKSQIEREYGGHC